MNKWDEKQIFKAETIRTVVLAIIGAVLALLVIKPSEKDIEYQAELAKTKLSIQTGVVDEFLATSYRYTSVAFDACRGKEEERVLYGGVVYDDYRAALNRLKVYFEEQLSLDLPLKTIQTANKTFRKLCKPTINEANWEPARDTLKDAHNALARAALGTIFKEVKPSPSQ